MTSAPEQQTALTTTFSNIANNVVSQLAAACAATDVSITLLTGTGASFPPAPFYVSVEYEVLWCSNKTGDVLQVSRGVDGTTAAPHPANAIIQIRNNAGLFLDAYDAIHELDNGIVTGSALPANIAYTDKTQELTHKTIDLSDGSKGNVIIGNVQPDPSTLPYTNILVNGGFDDWYYQTATSLPAGGSTSGVRVKPFSAGWNVYGVNDSSVTVTKDRANIDGQNSSGIDALFNITTVQANDSIRIQQSLGNQLPESLRNYINIQKLIGAPVSASLRVKSVSGNCQVRINFYHHDLGNWVVVNGPYVTPGSTYQTIKFENVIWAPTNTTDILILEIEMKGVGQLALDNVMVNYGSVAGPFRPRFDSRPEQENLLTNGGMEVWQRGLGPFNIGVGQFGPDRWQLNGAGGDTISMSAEGSARDYASTRALKVVFTKGTGTTGLTQTLMSNDYPQLNGVYATFTARILTATPNGIHIGLYDPAATPNTWQSSDPAIADTVYRDISITTLLSGSSSYLQLGIWFDATGTYYIDNCTLVFSEVPGKYVPHHPADEMAQCLRYYEIIGDTYTVPTINGYNSAGANIYATFPFKVRKAVNPTITKNGTWSVFNAAQPAPFGSSVDGMTPSLTISAVGYGYSMPSAAGQNFTAEANP